MTDRSEPFKILGSRLLEIFPPGLLECNSPRSKTGPYSYRPQRLYEILTDNRVNSHAVERTIVSSAWYGKQKKSGRHEFIILHVEDSAIPGLRNCIALDRSESRGFFSSRPTGQFRVSYDGDLQRLIEECQLQDYLGLEKLRLRPNEPLRLLDLVTLVKYISESERHHIFHLADTNTYWFAGLIWECMREMCPTSEVDCLLRGRNGRLNYIRIRSIPNSVQVDVRNVLQEVNRQIALSQQESLTLRRPPEPNLTPEISEDLPRSPEQNHENGSLTSQTAQEIPGGSLSSLETSPVSGENDRFCGAQQESGSTESLSEDTVINSLMSASEIAKHLVEHGCPNITDRLDVGSCSEHPISGGGFGEVYRGKLKDGTLVAIKTMRLHIGSSEGQKPLKNAAREIHTWSKCQHSNVIELLGLVEFRGQIGMVSPWMKNGNLREYLSRKPGVDRCQLSIKISEGLSYLHQNNIVHGDLKGLNILISSEGTPMLTDFGSAILQDQTLCFTNTAAKSHLSPRWAAPEIIQGSGTYSYGGDIYALGMTILETMTGKVPFYEKNDHAVLFAVGVLKAHPERPEDEIPTDSQQGDTLWSLLAGCWNYEANGRPSAAEVVDIMKTITHNGLRRTSDTGPK